MARANLNKSKKKSWLIPPQYQSTYPGGPESASIEIPEFSLSGQIFLHWAAATLKELGEFQNKNSRPLFTITFKSKKSISRLEILVHLLK